MLDVHEMNVFLAAAETENFSEAARQLHLSQPAVSMHVKALEQELGVQLFERTGRRVQLSEAGAALMPLARDLVSMSRRIEETMRSLGGKVVGHLKIGCTTTAGKYILPHLIARFREMHPNVRATVRNSGSDQTMAWLREGTTHISVFSSLLKHRDVEFQHFFTDRVVLIAPPDHPWASRDSVQPEELTETEFILREETSGTRQVMDEALLEHGIHNEDLNVVMELGNSEAIEMAVEQGIGVSFVSWLMAKRCAALGRIKVVDVEGLDLERDLFIAYNRRRPATTAQNEFWKFVHQSCNETLLQLAA